MTSPKGSHPDASPLRGILPCLPVAAPSPWWPVRPGPSGGWGYAPQTRAKGSPPLDSASPLRWPQRFAPFPYDGKAIRLAPARSFLRSSLAQIPGQAESPTQPPAPGADNAVPLDDRPAPVTPDFRFQVSAFQLFPSTERQPVVP